MAEIDPKLLVKIDGEITNNGLGNERPRLDDALFNLEFYRGDFRRFPVRPPGGAYDAQRYPRYSLVMQRVVNVLAANLYRVGPSRALKAPAGLPRRPHEAAGEWLNRVYRRNAADALWQEADRMAAVSEVAAFQVSATPDPGRPIRIQLWDASQFCVWEDPDDPARPLAVATLDKYDEQRRLRLYTAELRRTYLTGRLGPGDTAGGTAFRFAGEEANPHEVIPFSFVHFNYPCCDFWGGSPGVYLRSVNDGMNFGLTEGFDCIRYNLRPIILFKNVRPGYRPPSPLQPGDVWDLARATNAADEAAGEADVRYLQADSAFVAAGWDDFQNYLDHVLEMVGVPPATVRMVQDAARSGVSIVAEQIPLILWAEGRQRPFSGYEDDLARLVLTLGAGHLGSQADATYRATAEDLESAAADPGLVLRWADMWPSLPGGDRDRADQWLLDNALASRTQILMRRDKLTREEAEARLREVAEDLRRERGLGGGRAAAGSGRAASEDPTTEREPDPDGTSEAESDDA